MTIGSGHIYCETNPPQSDFCSSLSPPTAQVKGELQAAKSSDPHSPMLVFHSTPKPFVPAVPTASDPRSHTCLPAPCSPRMCFCWKSTCKNITLAFPSLLIFLILLSVNPPPPSSSHYTVKTSPVILSFRRVGGVAPSVLFSHSSNSYLGNCTTRFILLLLLSVHDFHRPALLWF